MFIGKSNKISKSDFMQLFQGVAKPEKLSSIFNLFDENTSGFLEASEAEDLYNKFLNLYIENPIGLDPTSSSYQNKGKIVITDDGIKKFIIDGKELIILPNDIYKTDSNLDIKSMRDLINCYSELNSKDVNSDEAKPFNSDLPAEYSLQNLKKKYPESDYKYVFFNDNKNLAIRSKKTNKNCLEILGNTVIESNPKTGEVTEIRTFNFGKLVEYQNCIPDENGFEIKKLYKYDSKGNLSEVKTAYLKSGLSHKVVVTTYDENGNVISERERITPVGIADELFQDVSAKDGLIFTTRPTIAKHVKMINKSNVEDVLMAYKDVSGGENLFDSIISERNLPIEDRMGFVRHIIQQIFILAKEHGIKTDSIELELDKVINNEMNSLLPASASKIIKLTDELLDQINRKIPAEYIDAEKDGNGKIDKIFYQGSVGDCWLLAGIKSLTLNEQGLKLLDEAVDMDSNGNYIVRLAGVGVTYTISKEEVSKRTELSYGDMDVRAIEIAVERYLKEHPERFNDGDLNGGFGWIAYEMLTECKTNTYHGISDDLIKKFNDKNKVFVVGVGNPIPLVFIDENGQEQKLLGGHAYTVKGSDDKYVYIINPHTSGEMLAVPIKEFKSFFNHCDECILS